ncbi:hypothetical protein [Ensifer sp. 1H6]|uniref:hypothetical protein n=1 Tax=Ensifer sp. 1H6 TaxID=1911585 RepID=UPI0009CEF876|nr:hypothetical protein [Ensifer sp. 1H6]OMQ44933.1 hypothetical protein BKP54_11100 [Ensifer sp. 1H6]
MLAKVKVAFPGVPDGLVHPRNFEVGDTVEGNLAAVAIENDWADEVSVIEDSGAGSRPDADLEKMTVDQLKAHAAALALDLGAATKKADIVAVIAAASKPSE